MDLSEQEENSLITGIPLLSMAAKADRHQPHRTHTCKRGGAAAAAAVEARYRECLKNHAAGFGGIATDGCGEFMPCGISGTPEALNCSACGCHRNFHRRVVEGELTSSSPSSFDRCLPLHSFIMPRPVSMAPPLLLAPKRVMEDRKKRLRTKFTAEQKEKMAEYAERLGWRLQRQEEGVGRFCEEIGVKRRVFKVWMHNNKSSLALKNDGEKNIIE